MYCKCKIASFSYVLYNQILKRNSKADGKASTYNNNSNNNDNDNDNDNDSDKANENNNNRNGKRNNNANIYKCKVFRCCTIKTNTHFFCQ